MHRPKELPKWAQPDGDKSKTPPVDPKVMCAVVERVYNLLQENERACDDDDKEFILLVFMLCDPDAELALSIIARHSALTELYTSGALREFIRPDVPHPQLHPGAAVAAAVMPMRADGTFDPDLYVERVKLGIEATGFGQSGRMG